jgi:putative oxidoreductase
MRADDFGKLVLRLTLGGLLIFHGIAKLRAGPDAINGMVAAAGYPAQLGLFVYAGEFIAPLLVIFGLFTRPAALVIVINMLVALALAHTAQLFQVNAKSGGYALELQAFYLFGALALALLGPGAARIGGRSERVWA